MLATELMADMYEHDEIVLDYNPSTIVISIH